MHNRCRLVKCFVKRNFPDVNHHLNELSYIPAMANKQFENDMIPDKALQTFSKPLIPPTKDTDARIFTEDLSTQYLDKNIGGFNDGTLGELLGSIKEVNMRVQKVESVNTRLKHEKQALEKQLENHQREVFSLKKEIERLSLLQVKAKNYKKLQEQVSNTFQENCSLKESIAVVGIENSHLKGQIAELKVEMNKKMLQSPKESKVANIGSLQGMKLKPCNASSQGSSPKMEETPKFFSNQDGLKEKSDKLFSQLMQEKEVLEMQYNQMLDIHKETSLGNVMKDFSLLGFEMSDEEEIKVAKDCIQDLVTLKQDLLFINYNLKFILHFFLSRDQQPLTISPKLPSSCYWSELQPPNCLGSNLDVVPDGTSSNPLDSLDVKTIWTTPPSNNLKLGLTQSQQAIKEHIDIFLVNKALLNISNLVPNIGAKQHNQALITKAAETHRWSEQPKQQLCKDRLRQRPFSSISRDGGNLLTIDLNPPEPKLLPMYARSDSAECNVGSPPKECNLSDSMSMDGTVLQPNTIFQTINRDWECLRSPEGDNKRICPMCQTVFPKVVPQTDFEQHVVGHFDVEEFELI